MNKITKIAIIVAGVAAIIYLVKKAKKADKNNSTNSGNNEATTVKGPPALIDVPSAGAPGNRTGIVVDLTTRRCVDANGKIIYVKGPCPTNTTIVSANTTR